MRSKKICCKKKHRQTYDAADDNQQGLPRAAFSIPFPGPVPDIIMDLFLNIFRDTVLILFRDIFMDIYRNIFLCFFMIFFPGLFMDIFPGLFM